MINASEFSSRLQQIMQYYQISAAAFADQIQVPRSSISHLLSGRNRPSLDFVMKVVKQFKEVELYWLLNGKGDFPHQATNSLKTITIQEKSLPKESDKEIEQIVIFYKDGSFKSFKP